MVGTDVQRPLTDTGIHWDDILSCTPVYVVSMFRALIISITQLFSSRPDPLCSFIITALSGKPKNEAGKEEG